MDFKFRLWPISVYHKITCTGNNHIYTLFSNKQPRLQLSFYSLFLLFKDVEDFCKNVLKEVILLK
jgi:hypothetical protein